MTARTSPATSSGQQPTVVTADMTDLDIVSKVIAEAFHDLPPSRWLIPDPAARAAIFPAYFRLYAAHALAHGTVYTTPGRSAAALWLPTGPGPITAPPGYHTRLTTITGRWAPRFLAFDAALETRHPTGMAHHHLALLAVQPGCQGQGVGTALLRHHHAVLDHDGIPAYLEASGQRSRRLYLANGYTDHGPPVALPDGPVLYPMVRAWAHPTDGQPPAGQP